jgi:hypothetical protein
VRSLLNHGLIDELHLLVYPLSAATAPGCSPPTASRSTSRWADAKTFTGGVLSLTYTPPTDTPTDAT